MYKYTGRSHSRQKRKYVPGNCGGRKVHRTEKGRAVGSFLPSHRLHQKGPLCCLWALVFSNKASDK